MPELRKKCKLQRVFQLLKSFTRKLFISAQTKLIFHYRQPTENCQLEISKEISSDSNDAGSNIQDKNHSSSYSAAQQLAIGNTEYRLAAMIEYTDSLSLPMLIQNKHETFLLT